MKNLHIIFLAVLLTVTSIFAQSIFDKDASAFHKRAVKVCGTMKAQSHEMQQVSTVIAAASKELQALTQKYKNNPPAEYKNDPLWSAYFDDFADNLLLVKTFADQKNYKLASKYCSTFCMIFGRMHRNNGTMDVTDMLFALNMQMKLTTDMVNAGNISSAKENVGMIKKMLDGAAGKINKLENLAPLFVPINKRANEWLNAIENGQEKTPKTLYSKFMADFPKIFIASM